MKYSVYDSYEDLVTETDYLIYAKQRADANDGYVVNNERFGKIVYDSNDEF